MPEKSPKWSNWDRLYRLGKEGSIDLSDLVFGLGMLERCGPTTSGSTAHVEPHDASTRTRYGVTCVTYAAAG